jgi:hypothetical protein
MGFPPSASLCLAVGDAVESAVKAANSETVTRLNIMLILVLATYLRRPPYPEFSSIALGFVYIVVVAAAPMYNRTSANEYSSIRKGTWQYPGLRTGRSITTHQFVRLTVPFPMPMSVSMSGRVGEECNQLTFTSQRNLRVTFQNSHPLCQPILIYLRDDGHHPIHCLCGHFTGRRVARRVHTPSARKKNQVRAGFGCWHRTRSSSIVSRCLKAVFSPDDTIPQ